ncbi:MAG TPA: right-handed parallel beta-helix repeat-containing protein [Chitinophagaceae bacterium]|nr:right-handed parallel beta-helix repeat-containing protein [Chitinophagaceae bacterium]
MKLSMLKITVFALMGIWFALSISSCKKDKFLTNGGDLSFSTDTLKFDTVFTSLGNVTRSFKVFNTNNKPIKLSQIHLEGGSTSPFRMNINGVPTKDIKDVEIAANDSIYVFCSVTVDPTSGNLPFLVNDKVLFTLNGKTRDVPLIAYGQDAHYIVAEELSSQTWINDKPYVIIHSALIDSPEVLTIQKGCRIYMHQDSKLYVHGTLKIFGTKEDSVIFQGDRLDRDYFGYKDYPGEWGGLVFLRGSQQSNLNYCVIKNAGNATDAFTPAAINVLPPWVPLGGPIVELNNCTIANSSTFGLLGFNTNIRANNCLIHTCGLQNIATLEGGEYEFNYCTIATYGGLGINHAQQPSVAILNYRDISLTEFVDNNLTANFTNCIITGSLDDELFAYQKGSSSYNLVMKNCFVKRVTALPTNLVTATNCTVNDNSNYPQFVDYSKWDFHPETTSPMKGAGIDIPGIIIDLDQKSRPNPPSIGCYEVQ